MAAVTASAAAAASLAAVFKATFTSIRLAWACAFCASITAWS